MRILYVSIVAIGIVLITGLSTLHANDRLEASLRETITDLAGLGSRVTGYPGADQAAEYLKGRLRDLLIEEIYEQTFPQPVPMDQGFTLESDEGTIQIHAVWPNLVRTSTTPAGGISGPLVYGGDGSPADLNGRPVADRIVVVEYESGFKWVGAFHLGAKAVVFLGNGSGHRKEGSQKFLGVPADLPRYFVQDADAGRVRQLADAQKRATIRGKMVWKKVPTASPACDSVSRIGRNALLFICLPALMAVFAVRHCRWSWAICTSFVAVPMQRLRDLSD